MNSRSRNLVRLVLFVFCAMLGSLVPASGQDKQDPIAALFEGLPADLRANVGTNSVRRDRVNDWLGEQVDGKGKTVELRIAVTVTAVRSADKTYTVQFATRNRLLGGEGPLAGRKPLAVAVLGDTWPVLLRDSSGFGGNFGFVGVSTADAEKLVELKEIQIQAKVKHAHVNSDDISLTLEDVSVNGMKLTPRMVSTKNKGKGFGGGAPPM
jgi:hypothetical protein